jgi:hypothetical protein
MVRRFGGGNPGSGWRQLTGVIPMSEGPYLTAALFCERVIEDKERVLTIVRIMDSIIIDLPEDIPADFPSDENRLPVSFDGLVSLKTGKSPGEHTIRIDMISPSGKRSENYRQTVTLSPEEHGGANLMLHNTVSVKKGGLFYFEVFIDDKLATRLPFRIDVRRQAAVQPTPPPERKAAETTA